MVIPESIAPYPSYPNSPTHFFSLSLYPLPFQQHQGLRLRLYPHCSNLKIQLSPAGPRTFIVFSSYIIMSFAPSPWIGGHGLVVGPFVGPMGIPFFAPPGIGNPRIWTTTPFPLPLVPD